MQVRCKQRSIRIGNILCMGALFLMGPLLSASAQTPGGGLHTWLAPAAVSRFHGSRGEELVWAEAGDYDGLLAALDNLAAHGLEPTHYHLEELIRLRPDLAARDRLATDAWFSAAAHMVYGKLDPVSMEPDWTAARRSRDLSESLARALAEGTVAQSLDALAPTQHGYHVLKEELERVMRMTRERAARISDGPTLRIGERGARVRELQARLVQLALLSQDAQSDVFDETTAAAVIAFQDQANLDADGLVGPATLAALNRGRKDMANQLRVNLERWRWLPDNLGRRHLRVNIAGFDVTAWENSQPLRTYLAIIGRPYRKTPVFSDEAEHIVFNPWWEVPPRLARADKLPAFRADPESVQTLGFHVLDSAGRAVDPTTIDWNSLNAGNFPYRLRQAPGVHNALGQVKIMFPNKHNVYLHDTPTRGLFAQRQRAFSSGCIRTQDVVDLAEWLLAETQGWDRGRIDDAIAGGRETRVTLSSSVPVHVLYFSAVAEVGDAVRYLDDIYDRDAAVLAALSGPPD